MNDLGKNVLVALKVRRWTRGRLAREVGMTRQGIYQLLDVRREPKRINLKLLRRIGVVLELTPNELLGAHGNTQARHAACGNTSNVGGLIG